MLWLLMIALVLAFTWYFSLRISYSIRMAGDGRIELTSFRRVVTTHPREITLVEGPFLPIGFVRFKLEKEKVYLFCLMHDQALLEILKAIGKLNPDVKFKTR